MIPFGTPRRHVAECGSTNDLAREWTQDPDDPAPSGALVTADFQTRGRGRRGREWQAAAAESALMSFVYRLPPDAEVGQLGLVVALAVADALASVTYLDPRLKWPNDILLEGCKAAGILVEAAPPAPTTVDGGGAGEDAPVGARFIAPFSSTASSPTPAPPELGAGGAVLGIGVNVNQARFDGAEEFVYPPTSLRLASGQAWEIETVIAAVGRALSAWEDRWRREGFLPILEECRARLAVGALVRQGGNRAELSGLEASGAAEVRLPDGTFALWRTVD